MKTTEYKSILEKGVWVLRNLCRANPPPNYELVREAIPFLSNVILEGDNQEILEDALGILVDFSDGGERSIQDLIDLGWLIKKLVSLLKYIIPKILIL